MAAPDTVTTTLPRLECACANARRTARVITQLYASYLRPTGLEPAQFALLFAIESAPGATQSALGHALALDKTTLSRNLALLKRDRLIAATPPGKSQDRRERRIRLTPSGVERIACARPYWQRAQHALRDAMPPADWTAILHTLEAATQAAQTAATQAPG
jgi:DNA-binding MarR family transcriptional regulator